MQSLITGKDSWKLADIKTSSLQIHRVCKVKILRMLRVAFTYQDHSVRKLITGKSSEELADINTTM